MTCNLYLGYARRGFHWANATYTIKHKTGIKPAFNTIHFKYELLVTVDPLLQAMWIENAFLLLASSWLFSMASWDTVGIPAAVFCSFLIGETQLEPY